MNENESFHHDETLSPKFSSQNCLGNTDGNINFSDHKNEINVVYSGLIPNLFKENKGVVAEGFLEDKNYFKAEKILAKHDENYMPPEIEKALEGRD